MPKQLVTIAEFDNEANLNIIESILDENKIYNFVADEYIGSASLFYTTAAGMIKLQVRTVDIQKAVQILNENGFNDFSNKLQLKFCRECNALDVKIEKPTLAAIIKSIPLLFIPLLLKNRNYRCISCGVEWKEKPGRYHKTMTVAIVIIVLFGALGIYFTLNSEYTHKAIFEDKVIALADQGKLGSKQHTS